MSDPRPRPQYGEYATPEEVAEITGRDPHEPVDVHAGTSIPVETAEPAAPPTASAPTPPSGAAPAPRAADRIDGPAPARGTAVTPRFAWDRPVSWALLATGVVYFLMVAASYPQYGTALRQSFETLGSLGSAEFTSAGFANDLGPWIGMTHLLLLLVTIGATLAARRRLRVVFWIPLVGALVFGIVMTVFSVVILLHDPTLLDALAPTARPTP